MDKLTVINNALVNTGNQRLNALYDGSDEWTVTDLGFTRALRFLTSRHNWTFAQTVVALTRVPDDQNLSRVYRDNGFAMPSCLHMMEVYYDETVLQDYEVLGNVLSCAYADSIYAKIINQPTDASWHPMAEEVLTLMLESSCLRGLNEDFQEADKRWNAAENLLFETRPRVDQTNPARNLFKPVSRMARIARRR